MTTIKTTSICLSEYTKHRTKNGSCHRPMRFVRHLVFVFSENDGTFSTKIVSLQK